MDQPIPILVAIVGALLALSLVSALLVVRRREPLLRRIQALFRRPQEPGKPPGPKHYYKTYWS